MFYPKNKSKSLDDGLFKNPTSEYRGTPFWAWNCALNKEEMAFQIETLKKMGFGGFHMHSRTGMATEYLSDEFFDFVKFCVDKAKKEGMLAYLYDEDRWPSGAAGGLVTKDVRHRAKRLVLTCNRLTDAVDKQKGINTGLPYLLCCYDIVLDDDGRLTEYKDIKEDGDAKGRKWFAYVMTNQPTPWFNNQTYVDTLSKDAMDRFIELTYEGYKKAVGGSFGSTVKSIFTDEPQFNMRSPLTFSTDTSDVEIPWTTLLADEYFSITGQDILKTLPELFWERADGQKSKTRYNYMNLVAELFAKAFMDNCGKWCAENGLYLTGHMMLEPTLELQSWAISDVMRAYRSFTLPGIDILCERMEFSTAKQAQSAVHQFGREGMLSELYGVMNYDYDFRGQKFQGDWQAALGVTVRVPHLSWMSMKGEAKRDYPASFNYQSPWHKEYSYMEDHYSRIATAMTRGKCVVKVGVIHPIETFWFYTGPKDKTSDIRRNLDDKFKNVIEWLLFSQIDFDFINESLLPSQCDEGANPLKVGQAEYDAVVVPALETLRSSTLSRLEEFSQKGGKLIFMGKCPTMIDAILSDSVKPLYEKSTVIDFDKIQLLDALKEQRFLCIKNADGTTSDNLLYQMREDNDCKWLFIAQGKKKWEFNAVQQNVIDNIDVVKPQKVKIIIDGVYQAVIYDTLSGEIFPAQYLSEKGKTTVYHTLYANDSLLLKLIPASVEAKNIITKTERQVAFTDDYKCLVDYQLEEDNVYLLDRAEFSFDGAPMESEEEVLRIDNILRARLGWDLRQKKIAQPWAEKEGKAEHFITLRYLIDSLIDFDGARLALENLAESQICFNGQKIENLSDGYFVDKAIEKVKLPTIKKGQNVLTITQPYYRRGSLEWAYLLGAFGVKIAGATKTITTLPEKIGFGSIVGQGMPFYGGNIIYKLPIRTDSDLMAQVKVSMYRGTMIKAIVGDSKGTNLVFSPYVANLGDCSKENPVLNLKLFGNRYNTFAGLHNCDKATYYFGPDYWRSDGDGWAYEYFCKDFGIMKSPIITYYKKEN